MLPKARAAFNREKRKERAHAFGALFDWKISVAWFPIDSLSPRDAAARGRSYGSRAIRDAGLDHYQHYRESRRPVAIVGQPYASGFECGTRVVAEVERGIRILKLDPLRCWYSVTLFG